MEGKEEGLILSEEEFKKPLNKAPLGRGGEFKFPFTIIQP